VKRSVVKCNDDMVKLTREWQKSKIPFLIRSCHYSVSEKYFEKKSFKKKKVFLKEAKATFCKFSNSCLEFFGLYPIKQIVT